MRRGVRTVQRSSRIFQRHFWKSMPKQPVKQSDAWDAVRSTIARARETDALSHPSERKQNSNRHKSISESLIKEVPVIEVDGTMAMCDGGTLDS